MRRRHCLPFTTRAVVWRALLAEGAHTVKSGNTVFFIRSSTAFYIVLSVLQRFLR